MHSTQNELSIHKRKVKKSHCVGNIKGITPFCRLLSMKCVWCYKRQKYVILTNSQFKRKTDVSLQHTMLQIGWKCLDLKTLFYRIVVPLIHLLL